jgi:hypothetical protein
MNATVLKIMLAHSVNLRRSHALIIHHSQQTHVAPVTQSKSYHMFDAYLEGLNL